MTLTGFLRKSTNSARLFQKGALGAGRFLSKAADWGGRVLDATADTLGPVATLNPAFQVARTAIGVAKVAGNAGQEIGGAHDLRQVGGALGDAFKGLNRVAAGAGPSQLETAA